MEDLRCEAAVESKSAAELALGAAEGDAGELHKTVRELIEKLDWARRPMPKDEKANMQKEIGDTNDSVLVKRINGLSKMIADDIVNIEALKNSLDV